jgi:hypothetical protein
MYLKATGIEAWQKFTWCFWHVYSKQKYLLFRSYTNIWSVYMYWDPKKWHLYTTQKLFKLHASRRAKLFQENKSWEKSIKILRKLKRFKNQIIINMPYVINDWFCSIYCDLFLVIYVDCKCRLQFVNYPFCSLYNILLLSTFSKNFIKINILL